MAIYLVRHPQPLGAGERCYGRTELEVDAHALELAERSVRAQLPGPLLARARILTSPAQRCQSLARALAAPRAPTIEPDLREMDFGRWEGLPWASIPRAEIDAWAADVWHYRPGGIESAALIAERWRRWQAALATDGGGQGDGDRDGETPIVAVTHAGLIRVALVAAGRLERGEIARARIPFGSVHLLERVA